MLRTGRKRNAGQRSSRLLLNRQRANSLLKDVKVFETMRSQHFFQIIAGGALLLLGIVFSDIPTMIMSQGWPATEGKIDKSRIVGTGIRGWDGEVFVETKAYVSYRYIVNGTSYTSSVVNSIKSPFSLYPRSYATRYPAGKDVTVYYNPKDPSEAVLEPGFIDPFKAFDVFSYLFFGAGIYSIYRGISSMQRKHVRAMMNS
jgi:hypothetical protein